MDIYVFIVIAIVLGYLCGSIPFALIISKVFYKTDVRKYGSKNLGATNVTRTLGVLAGVSVLVLDVLKGGLPAYILYQIAANVLDESQLHYTSIIYCTCGLFCAIGHCHPCFARFKGGKAVASICGFLLFMNIKLFLVAVITFVIAVAITRIVSVGSILAAITVPIFSFIPFFIDSYTFKFNELFPALCGSKTSLFIYYLIIFLLALLLIYRHLGNIQRLLKGEEKKFHIEKINKKA